MTLLSSRDNPLIKDYTRLCSSGAFRASSGRFAFEGVRLCEDALASGLRLGSVFLTAPLMERQAGLTARIMECGADVYEITEPVGQKLADTQNPQGVFCTAFMLDKAPELDKIDVDGAYIALESLQDPGNLGTVLRTAEALGLSGVLLSGGCCDIYSPKVVRSAMGAVFRLPFLRVPELPPVLGELTLRGMKTLAAVADSSAPGICASALHGGVVAAIGNEGAGLTEACVAACAQRVTIPMAGRAQSLNAAAAATIIMWEISRGR